MNSIAQAPRYTPYDVVTDRICELLERGVVPWRQPWRSIGAPRSLASGKDYRGINVFILGSAGFSSPHWLTFKQAAERGGHVRKGEKGWPIVFWKWPERAAKNAAPQNEDTTSEYGRGPLLRYYTVFNVTQCEGLQYPLPDAPTTVEPIAECERIVESMPKRPTIRQGGRACYMPILDTIEMPARDVFVDSAAYYATLFHELAHATGHESRLKRRPSSEPRYLGDSAYAREELVAEMGSALLCGQSGIDTATIENSAAYIANWLKALRDDRRLVVFAAAQAQKAADFILGRTFAPAAD